jgi:hypothetical protein
MYFPDIGLGEVFVVNDDTFLNVIDRLYKSDFMENTQELKEKKDFFLEELTKNRRSHPLQFVQQDAEKVLGSEFSISEKVALIAHEQFVKNTSPFNIRYKAALEKALPPE